MCICLAKRLTHEFKRRTSSMYTREPPDGQTRSLLIPRSSIRPCRNRLEEKRKFKGCDRSEQQVRSTITNGKFRKHSVSRSSITFERIHSKMHRSSCPMNTSHSLPCCRGEISQVTLLNRLIVFRSKRTNRSLSLSVVDMMGHVRRKVRR